MAFSLQLAAHNFRHNKNPRGKAPFGVFCWPFPPKGCVKLYPSMVKEYLENLRSIWSGPADFFERNFGPSGEKDAFQFAVLTSFLVALELGLSEAWSGGSLGMVALVTVLMLIGMPFFMTAWVFLWASFMKLCGYLLGESLPLGPLRRVSAYSAAGLVALGVGFGLGKWLALAVFVFQIFGVEKSLRCSRWTAAVYVGLPFSLVAVLMGFFTLMFKVFK